MFEVQVPTFHFVMKPNNSLRHQSLLHNNVPNKLDYKLTQYGNYQSVVDPGYQLLKYLLKNHYHAATGWPFAFQ